jgi:hypothetical protein
VEGCGEAVSDGSPRVLAINAELLETRTTLAQLRDRNGALGVRGRGDNCRGLRAAGQPTHVHTPSPHVCKFELNWLQ